MKSSSKVLYNNLKIKQLQKCGTQLTDKSMDSLNLSPKHIGQFKNSRIKQKQNHYSLIIKPKIDLKTQLNFSFDKYSRNRNNIQKVIKHKSLSIVDTKIRTNKLLFNKIKENASKYQTNQSNMIKYKKVPINLFENSERKRQLRRQIESKFNKTRLILKFQDRVKKLQGMHRIYNKNVNLKYDLQSIQRDHKKQMQIKKLKKNTQTSQICSPWSKEKLQQFESMEDDLN